MSCPSARLGMPANVAANRQGNRVVPMNRLMMFPVFGGNFAGLVLVPQRTGHPHRDQRAMRASRHTVTELPVSVGRMPRLRLSTVGNRPDGHFVRGGGLVLEGLYRMACTGGLAPFRYDFNRDLLWSRQGPGLHVRPMGTDPEWLRQVVCHFTARHFARGANWKASRMTNPSVSVLLVVITVSTSAASRTMPIVRNRVPVGIAMVWSTASVV